MITEMRAGQKVAVVGGDLLGLRVVQPMAAVGWSPSDLATLRLWLDERGKYQDAAMTVPAVNDGDVVGGWADQSGEGNHGTQATVLWKPTLKLNIVNGQPVARFDGTDDWLAFNEINIVPGTVFVVVVHADVDYGTILGHTIVEYQFRFQSNATDVWMGGAGATIQSIVSGDTSVFHVAEIEVTATTDRVGINGVFGAADAHSESVFKFDRMGTRRANSVPLDGDIAEVLIYDSALSDADRGLVEAYLMTKYGIS